MAKRDLQREIVELLDQPEHRAEGLYGFDIARRLHVSTGRTQSILVGLVEAEILESYLHDPLPDDPPDRPRRRYYRLTTGGRTEFARRRQAKPSHGRALRRQPRTA